MSASASYSEASLDTTIFTKPTSPISTRSTVSDSELEKFHSHDRATALFFYVNLGFSFIIGIAGLLNGYIKIDAEDFTRKFASITTIDTFVTVVLAVGLSLLSLKLFKRKPMLMLHLTNVVAIFLLIALAIVVNIFLNPIMAMLLGIVVMIWLGVYWKFRSYFFVSSALIKLVTIVSDSNFGVYSVLVVTLLVSYYYSFFFLLSTYAFLVFLDEGAHSVLTKTTTCVYLVACYLWNMQVFLQTSRTIIATVYDQYFNEDSTLKMSLPQIIRLALTKYFGSICSGAKLVLPIASIRWYTLVLLGLPSNSSFMAVSARNYNYYAFNNIIAKRMSYRAAANLVWDDIQRTGVINLIDHSYISTMFGKCSVAISLISALAAALVLYISDPTMNVVLLLFEGVLQAFVVSYTISVAIFQIIDVGTSSIFVVLAQNSKGIQRKHPHLLDAITSHYHITSTLPR